jgi:hypothetical protein
MTTKVRVRHLVTCFELNHATANIQSSCSCVTLFNLIAKIPHFDR